MNAIPIETAVRLCSEVLEENKAKWYTLRAMQCWGCLLFSESVLDRMCVISPRGCRLVNERYQQPAHEGILPDVPHR